MAKKTKATKAWVCEYCHRAVYKGTYDTKYYHRSNDNLHCDSRNNDSPRAKAVLVSSKIFNDSQVETVNVTHEAIQLEMAALIGLEKAKRELEMIKCRVAAAEADVATRRARVIELKSELYHVMYSKTPPRVEKVSSHAEAQVPASEQLGREG